MLAYDRAPLRLRAFDREGSSFRSIVAAGENGSAARNPIADSGFGGSLRRRRFRFPRLHYTVERSIYL